MLAVTIALERATAAKAFDEPTAHGVVVAAPHIVQNVAEAFGGSDDANLLEVLTMVVGIGIWEDAHAPSGVTGDVFASEMAQALGTKWAVAVEAQHIAVGHTAKVKAFIWHRNYSFRY